MSVGALHDRSIRVCPFAVAVSPVGAPGDTDAVVPVIVVDQGPSPAAVTARAWTSYWAPTSRPVNTWVSGPEPVQASCTTVQFRSALLAASLRICRRSYAVTAEPPSSDGALQATVRELAPEVTDVTVGEPNSLCAIGGSTMKPCPQVLLGSGLLTRCSAFSLR